MRLTDFNLVNSLLFPAPESTYNTANFPQELIWVPKSLDPANALPEECIPCLLFNSPSARFFLLYFHSNAEDLGRCHGFCNLLRLQFQVHVLAVEYPGYGICPGGRATDQSVIDNASVALRFVNEVLKWPMEEIIVFGRSIGCGPALELAADRNLYGVVLVCPFLSLRTLCREFVGPLADLVDERFPNKERMQRVISPMLLVHGKQDQVVPWQHGQALYEACKAKKRLVLPDQMNHNTNLHVDASFFVLPMLQFFGLPDYNFDSLRIPEWVYNRRMSPFYRDDEKEAPPPTGASPEVWHSDTVHVEPPTCQAEPSPPRLDDPSPESPRAEGPLSPVRARWLAEAKLSTGTIPIRSSSDSEEELPTPPEELGFRKVPRTRHQGPQLHDDVVDEPCGLGSWILSPTQGRMKDLENGSDSVSPGLWLNWLPGLCGASVAPKPTPLRFERPMWAAVEPKFRRRDGPGLNVISAEPVRPVKADMLPLPNDLAALPRRKERLRI